MSQEAVILLCFVDTFESTEDKHTFNNIIITPLILHYTFVSQGERQLRLSCPELIYCHLLCFCVSLCWLNRNMYQGCVKQVRDERLRAVFTRLLTDAIHVYGEKTR